MVCGLVPGLCFKLFLGLEEGFAEFALQEFLGGEFRQVLGYADAGFVELQEFDLLASAFGAEYQAEGAVFAGLHFYA